MQLSKKKKKKDGVCTSEGFLAKDSMEAHYQKTD